MEKEGDKNMERLTMGSLFDGSGGFPLAAEMCGMKAVWASEVEPYPIAVTRSRFPQMRHLGDVSKIHGAKVEPVDVITFGSPCQDMSIAGKRDGLKHTENGDEETTRSGLFMEAVRIIKEMREATNGKYPTFAVWENVAGTFSSNRGKDFKTVLEELVKIAEPQATAVPAPGKNGWPSADILLGDGWSIAYRVFDARYWGVPQRRKRIYLVADFRGQRAGKILFERKGLRRYFEKGPTPRKGTAANAERSTGTADNENGIKVAGFKDKAGAKAGGMGFAEEKSPILLESMVPSIIVYDCRGNGDGKTVPTITGDHNNRVTDYTNLILQPKAYSIGNGQPNSLKMDNVCKTIDCMHDKQAVLIANCAGIDCRNMKEHQGLYPTLQAKPNGGQSLNFSGAVRIRYIIRRLTPTECARLQGFPDKWGHPNHKDDFTHAEYQFWQDVRNTHAAINGKAVKEYTKQQMLTWYNKLHTDSAEYKMWGNGIALPNALYVMQGIAKETESKR